MRAIKLTVFVTQDDGAAGSARWNQSEAPWSKLAFGRGTIRTFMTITTATRTPDAASATATAAACSKNAVHQPQHQAFVKVCERQNSQRNFFSVTSL
jgi:hypothetical protein